MSRNEKFISLVCLISDEDRLDLETLRTLHEYLEVTFSYFELIIVDYSSKSSINQIKQLEEFVKSSSCTRYIRTRKILSDHSALTVGLERSSGEVSVCISLSANHLPWIERIYDEVCRDKITRIGVRDGSQIPLGYRFIGAVFYYLTQKILVIDLVKFPTPLLAIYRTELSRLNQLNSRFRYPRFLLNRKISRPILFKVNNQLPIRRTSRSWLSAVNLGIDLITFNSTRLLRAVTILSMVFGVGEICYISYAVLVTLVRQGIAPGWATLSIQSALQFLMLSVVLAVLSEYLGRFLLENEVNEEMNSLHEIKSTRMVPNSEQTRNVVTSEFSQRKASKRR